MKNISPTPPATPSMGVLVPWEDLQLGQFRGPQLTTPHTHVGRALTALAVSVLSLSCPLSVPGHRVGFSSNYGAWFTSLYLIP